MKRLILLLVDSKRKLTIIELLHKGEQEDELFNYVGVEKEYVRMKHSKLDYGSKEKDEKEFELNL